MKLTRESYVENKLKHQTLNHIIIFKFRFHGYYFRKILSKNILIKVLFKETSN